MLHTTENVLRLLRMGVRLMQVTTGLVLLLLSSAVTDALAQQEWSFRPQAANIVGTDRAHTPLPFTRVWTQLGGELAIDRVQERYVNLTMNLPVAIRGMLRPPPIVAYSNYAWADQLLRIICTLDLSQSDLALGHLAVVLTVSKGSIGTTPVGTILSVSDFRVFVEDGVPVMTADFRYAPGVFPEVLPTSLTITDQLVPDVWKTRGPGPIIAEHTFTSVQPPDGSDPLVYTLREEIPIQ